MTTGPSWIPPRLAHLRTDRRGIPVPWINLWRPADTADFPHDQLRIGHDRNVGMDAVFMDDDDMPHPDFTKQNYGRQRASIVEGLCQVCGRFVPWSRRYLVYADLSVEKITIGGQERVALFEPWLDEWCATTAIDRCPALIRRRRDEKLTLIKVRSQHDVELSVSTGWLAGPLEAATKAEHVAMLCRIVLAPR